MYFRDFILFDLCPGNPNVFPCFPDSGQGKLFFQFDFLSRIMFSKNPIGYLIHTVPYYREVFSRISQEIPRLHQSNQEYPPQLPTELVDGWGANISLVGNGVGVVDGERYSQSSGS